MSIIEYVGSIGGIAGVLAFLIFWAYRYLVSQMREDRRFMEDRMTGILDAYNEVCRANQEIQMKHTEVLTQLITWLKAKNGSK